VLIYETLGTDLSRDGISYDFIARFQINLSEEREGREVSGKQDGCENDQLCV
jgi:hypothetical protein